jgi:multidrug efflux pump subunit AcrA (membrane-fusion protein)
MTQLGVAMAALVVAPMSALAEDPPEVQVQRRALNEAQAKLAADQVSDYLARKQAIADEQAAKEAAYQQAVAARDAGIRATDAKAAADRAAWERAVAACTAGDRSQCAPAVK